MWRLKTGRDKYGGQIESAERTLVKVMYTVMDYLRRKVAQKSRTYLEDRVQQENTSPHQGIPPTPLSLATFPLGEHPTAPLPAAVNLVDAQHYSSTGCHGNSLARDMSLIYTKLNGVSRGSGCPSTQASDYSDLSLDSRRSRHSSTASFFNYNNYCQPQHTNQQSALLDSAHKSRRCQSPDSSTTAPLHDFTAADFSDSSKNAIPFHCNSDFVSDHSRCASDDGANTDASKSLPDSAGTLVSQMKGKSHKKRFCSDSGSDLVYSSQPLPGDFFVTPPVCGSSSTFAAAALTSSATTNINPQGCSLAKSTFESHDSISCLHRQLCASPAVKDNCNIALRLPLPSFQRTATHTTTPPRLPSYLHANDESNRVFASDDLNCPSYNNGINISKDGNTIANAGNVCGYYSGSSFSSSESKTQEATSAWTDCITSFINP